MTVPVESPVVVKPARIGLLNEGSLHAELKDLYLTPGSLTEVRVRGFVVDILQPDGDIVEIQTGSVAKLKAKLKALVADHRVVLVYPLAVEKQLVVFDAGQHTVLYTRMSPRKASLADAFGELVGISPLLADPNLELRVLLTRQQEIRRSDGRGSWRRRGVTIVDRRLLEVREEIRFREVADYLAVLPDGCPEVFTNRELAAVMGVSLRTAGRLTYCLRALGAIALQGKQGRSYLFERTARAESDAETSAEGTASGGAGGGAGRRAKPRGRGTPKLSRTRREQ